MRTGYADFWELYKRNALPRETKNYVPQVLAAAIMVKNPARYGLEGVVADAPMVNDSVGVDYAMDLRLAADVTGTTLANMVAINPALLRLSTPAGIHYDLHVPQGTKAEFERTDRGDTGGEAELMAVPRGSYGRNAGAWCPSCFM